MAEVHTITFYPVGNGDTVQIALNNGRRVLLDFCQKDGATNDRCPEMDIATHLQDELSKADRSSFDVVAFTHADKDHIQGSTEFFELLHAKAYQGDGRIEIDELWVPAAMLLEEAEQDKQKEEFVLWRQEARHRLLTGERIRVFSKPSELKEWLDEKLRKRGERTDARDHLFVDAGTTVPTFSIDNDHAEFFCHSPFIRHVEDGDIVRNQAALAFNIRLRADGQQFQFLEIGDAASSDLEDIVSTTRAHKNGDRLDWDLFNVPHHCSYKALNEDEKGGKKTKPTPLVDELLQHGQKDAYVVSCSRPIPDDNEAYDATQPPHIQARKTYDSKLEEVDGRKFLVTMEQPNEDTPKPIVFNIGGDGLSWDKAPSLGAAALVSSRPPRAGS